jgi:hypothetical protein
MPTCQPRGGLHSLAPPATVLLYPFPHSIPSEPKIQKDPCLHVVYCANNILNILLHFQHPIDHQCLGRLCKDNWDRPFQESLRYRDRTRKFSRGYPRTAPRTREEIQGLPRGKSDTNQLPQPGGECHPGVLGHSRRGGQPGKSHHTCHLVTHNVSSSGSLPTGKGPVRWDRCPPLCSSP